MDLRLSGRLLLGLTLLSMVVSLVSTGVAGAQVGLPGTGNDPAVSEDEAIATANRDPNAKKEMARNPDLYPSAEFDDGHWQVRYYAHGDAVALVIVDDDYPYVRESWTGFQVAWKMARGYSGSFGHKLNAPYVFIPLCLIFLIGLVDWRRLWRIANLDLLVLLGFTASHIFFNRGNIGMSVPLVYPPLVYLLGRMLWIGFRGPGDGLRPVWSAKWLLIATLFLFGFRAGLNIADSGVIDVGYAGVIGADKIADGSPLYGDFPDDNSSGDTYGPVNYLAYVPWEQALPWSGSWDDLPAAHGAALLFDLAAMILLFVLGRRIRPGPEGQMLAATLVFGWAAYPYTAFALESNSNDSLVAALLIGTLVLLAKPAARGAMFALAFLTKFAPIVLAPMFAMQGEKGRLPGRSAIRFSLAFILVAAALMAWPLINPGPRTFYDSTFAYQSGRSSPFGIWGQAPSLHFLKYVLLAWTAGLALVCALVPKRRSIGSVAALCAALMISIELTAEHWFYLYIPWFYGAGLVALALSRPEPEPSLVQSTAQAPLQKPLPLPPSPRRLPQLSRSARASE